MRWIVRLKENINTQILRRKTKIYTNEKHNYFFFAILLRMVFH